MCPFDEARFKTVIADANVRLAELGLEPIFELATPHSLRRTYASLRAALRDDPIYIAEQMGHRDARFTFRVYQRAAKRRERLSGAHLEQFDRACEWAGFRQTNGQNQGARAEMGPSPAPTRIAGNAVGKLESGTARL